jgi:hypothetical protein
MSIDWEHRTSNVERPTSNVSWGNELSYRVENTIARVCFVRHSPLPGANDEQRRHIWNCYPGLRLLRSLTLGYHVSPFQGLEIVRPKVCDSIQLGSSRGGGL